MRLVRSTVGAELLQLQPVGIVATVLLGDVVTVLAHLARQGDLRPYICTGGHVRLSFRLRCSLRRSVCSGGGTRSPDLTIMSRAL